MVPETQHPDQFRALGSVGALRCVVAAPGARARVWVGGDSAPLGVAAHSAQNGEILSVVRDGPIEDYSWSWEPGWPVFAAPDGTLTQDPELARGPGYWLVPVGRSVTPTLLQVRIASPVRLA